MTHQVIWKYAIPNSSCTFIQEMPKDAEILCVQMQSGEPQIWVLVDPERKVEDRRFAIIGTGRGREDLSKSQYIGTFQTPFFVWHVFEIKGEK